MGSIRKRGNKWYIDYYDGNNRIRKSCGMYREHAEIALKEIEVQLFKGTYISADEQKALVFDKFVDEYYRIHVLQNLKSKEEQKRRLDSLVKYFGMIYLSEFTKHMILKYREFRLQSVCNSTVNKDIALIRSVFNRAIDWGFYNGVNPTKGIKKLKENNERDVYLTEENEQKIFKCCYGSTRSMAVLARNTGLRWSELRFLSWEKNDKNNYVDMDKKYVLINAGLSKSGKSRCVPLNEDAYQILAGTSKYPWSNYIFINEKTGKPFTTKRKAFKKGVEAAGLKDIRWHDLRHLFGIRLAENRVPLYEIQTLMGHSSPTVTMRYARYHPDYLRGAVETLNVKEPKLISQSIGHNMGTRASSEEKDEENIVVNIVSLIS